jgi:HSP20 family molecular chaperone IbpA
MRRDDLPADFELAYGDLCRRPHHGRLEPNADVRLSDDEQTLIVTLDVAGADAERLRIALEGDRLIILGVREDRERSSRGAILMKEIAYGPFLKRIRLPIAVAHREAVVSYRDGMLVVRLAVAEQAHVLSHRTEVKVIVQRIGI